MNVLTVHLQGLLFNISAFTFYYMFVLIFLWKLWNFRVTLFNMPVDPLCILYSLFSI